MDQQMHQKKQMKKVQKFAKETNKKDENAKVTTKDNERWKNQRNLNQLRIFMRKVIKIKNKDEK